MKHEESDLQAMCVKWFDLMYPNLLLYAIPNGGKRSIKTAMAMKREGVKKGVADLFLMRANNGYHGLFIEMKSKKGVQSPEQKAFESRAKFQGYDYKICKTFDEFEKVIKDYLE